MTHACERLVNKWPKNASAKGIITHFYGGSASTAVRGCECRAIHNVTRMVTAASTSLLIRNLFREFIPFPLFGLVVKMDIVPCAFPANVGDEAHGRCWMLEQMKTNGVWLRHRFRQQRNRLAPNHSQINHR